MTSSYPQYSPDSFVATIPEAEVREAFSVRLNDFLAKGYSELSAFVKSYLALENSGHVCSGGVWIRKAGFDPNQPRDDQGQWTDTGVEGGAEESLQYEFRLTASGASTPEWRDKQKKIREKYLAEANAQDAIRGGLTKEETEALVSYIGTDYRIVNKLLRGDTVKLTPKEKLLLSQRTKLLRGMIQRSTLANDLVVFRGASLDEKQSGKLKPGAVISDKAFTSATMSLGTATTFATIGLAPDKTRTIFRIEAAKGSRALLSTSFSAESEVLLPTNSKFKISTVKTFNVEGKTVRVIWAKYLDTVQKNSPTLADVHNGQPVELRPKGKKKKFLPPIELQQAARKAIESGFEIRVEETGENLTQKLARGDGLEESEVQLIATYFEVHKRSDGIDGLALGGKLASKWADRVLRKYNPDQPRDYHGRWDDQGSPSERVASALETLYEKFPVNPDNPNERVLIVQGKPALTLEVAQREDRLRLKTMRAFEPGQGLGTIVLNRITRIADQHGVTLEMTASPYGPEKNRISSEKLRSWYESYGFHLEEGFDPALGYMIREPKVEKYDPDQPRDYHGRWTGADGLVSNETLAGQDAAIRLLKNNLKMLATMQAGHISKEAFVLEHGQGYKMDKDTFKCGPGKPQACYMNATQAALADPELTYVEGFVDIGPLPIAHAWVVTKEGIVRDPTLRAETGKSTVYARAYFGVPINNEYLMKTMLKTKVYGVISHTNMDIFRGGVDFKKYSPDQPRDYHGRWTDGTDSIDSTGKDQEKRIHDILQRADADPAVRAAEQAYIDRGDSRNDPGVLLPNGKYTPEADAVNQQIANMFLNPNAKPKEGTAPTAIFMLGKPGSGKTSTLKNAKDFHQPPSTMINSDDIKEKLPGYRGEIAASFHERSTDIARNYLTPQAIIAGHNLVFDMTDNAERLAATIASLKSVGYKIGLIHVHVDSATSAERAYERFKTKGRYVPLRVVLSYGQRPQNAYDTGKKLADQWRDYDNTERTPKVRDSGGGGIF